MASKTGHIAAYLEQHKDEIIDRWRDAAEKEKRNLTIFAQRSLRPEDVLPEWEKTIGVLGGATEVERFLETAQRLGAAKSGKGDPWGMTRSIPGQRDSSLTKEPGHSTSTLPPRCCTSKA